MIKAVYFVYKQHVALVKIGKYSGEIAGFFDRRTRSYLYLHAHFGGDDVRERGFTKSRRSV